MVKLQICCLLIILFITALYFQAKRVKTHSHILFSLSLWTTVFNLLFDMITVYTVNHLDTVSAWLNRICHTLFLGSLVMEVFFFYLYSVVLIDDNRTKKRNLWLAAVPVWVAWLGLVLLPIQYMETAGGNYSDGPALWVAKGIMILYTILMLYALIRHWREIDQKKRFSVALAFGIQIGVMAFQSVFPTSLISSMGLTLINLAFFMTVESPDVLLVEKLRTEKARADEANSAKSQFLSNMSHEIRTPMNTIVGMTDILLREELPKKTREYLYNIKNSGEALLTIINDILDFSKIEAGKLSIVEDEYEPMSIFNDLSMMFLNRIGRKRVELLYDISPDMPSKLYGDGQRLRQIIVNLMNNAIKFTESGYVRLKVEVNPMHGDWISLAVSVQDTGQGIKEEDIEKLFNSFQQVDMKKNHSKEGTGLGLSISKQLVELMHGEIGVRSVYGEGSTFYFHIPQKVVKATPAARIVEERGQKSTVGFRISNDVVREQLKELAYRYRVNCECYDAVTDKTVDFLILDSDNSVSEEERRLLVENGATICVLQNPMLENIVDKRFTTINKPLYSLNFCQLLNREELIFRSSALEELHFIAPQARILVVDDNEMNLKVARGLMEPFQMQVDTAENGKNAVEMVQQKQYDIVFMDHMMPVMDGLQATAKIRELEGDGYRDLPIIALSANATVEAKEMFLRGKMNGFVAKPIKTRELAKCIIKWLPKEKVVMLEETRLEETEKENEDTGNSTGLPVINGIDVQEGIKNCGSKELFIELLGDFYKLIEPKCTKLEKCLADGMIRDFTIEVHALKNTARMIGAMKLSQLFYRMEHLGNEGNVEEIEKSMPQLISLYKSYKPLLREYANTPGKNQVQVSLEEVQKTLMRLHDAMDNFDLDGADSAMKELETYSVSGDLQSMMEQLSAYVADVAMEDVMRVTEEMCDKLREMDARDSGKPTIMLVDDDKLNIKAVTGMLQDNYRIIAADSGGEALSMLENRIPDMILLDVHMQGMDGHDVIHSLKENPSYAEIPVVFLTSDADEKTEIQGFSEGATDFIRKPFQRDVAIQRIRRILELSYLQKNLEQEVEKQTEVAEKRRESVERMSLQMVQALANTIDAKDSYTNGHSTRVAKYSVMIAERMGYTGERLELVQYTALLHDIGKIGIPNEIINKPSRLTDEEYEVIKTHPVIGSNILKEISEIPDIAIGARWHHERYDGKGYPDGIKGEEIPEIARIIGVADAYDAMTSKRSYRGVLSQEKVYAELEKGKGTQFDPKIEEIMIGLIKEDTDYQMHE